MLSIWGKNVFYLQSWKIFSLEIWASCDLYLVPWIILRIFSVLYFQIFLFSLYFPIIKCRKHLMFFHSFWILLLFSHCATNLSNSYWPIFKVIDYFSAGSSLLLSPSKELFILCGCVCMGVCMAFPWDSFCSFDLSTEISYLFIYIIHLFH